MSFIIFPLLFLLNITFAEDINQTFVTTPLLTISQINNGSLLDKPMIDCSSSKEIVKKSNKDLYNQCAVDLCGPPEKAVSSYVSDDQFYNSASWWNKLKVNFKDATIKQVFDIAIDRKLNELNDLEKYLQNPSLDNLSLQEQVLLANSVLFPYVKITARPDEKNIEDRVDIKIIPPRNPSPELEKILNDYAAKLKKSSTTNPMKFLDLNIYSEEELAQILKSMIAKIKESTIASNSDLIKGNPDVLNSLKFFEKLYEHDRPPLYEMKAHVFGILDILKYITNTTQVNVLNQYVCDVPECKKVYSDYVNASLDHKKLKDNILLYERFLKNPANKINAINRCKANIIYKEKKYSEQQEASKIFATAKDNVIKNVLPHFSEHSRKIMLDYLNNHLNVNNSKKGNIENSREFSKRAKEYIKTKEKKLDNNLERFYSLKALNDSFDSIDPLGDMKACATVTSTAWDSFVGINVVEKKGNGEDKRYFRQFGNVDQIFASDFTCQNADHGHHVVAHEIGHALSNLILRTKLSETSSALYRKLRSCITSSYLNAPQARDALFPIIHEDDGVFSEENTADFIAALSTPQDKKIYMCALLKKSSLTNTYADLKFISPYMILDRHSTPFSRIIFEAINKDIPLPQSCQKLIEEEKPEMRFQKCEL